MNLIKNARLHAKEIPRLYHSISLYYSVSKKGVDRVQRAFLNQKKLTKAFNVAQSDMDEAYLDSIRALNSAMTWLEQELAEEKKFIEQLDGFLNRNKNFVETIPEETKKAMGFPEHFRNIFFCQLQLLYDRLMALGNHLKERDTKRFKSAEVLDKIINKLCSINSTFLFRSL